MNASALRLEALHYPIQEVRANPHYDPQAETSSGELNTEILQHKIDERDDAIAIDVTISSIEDSNANNPYSFRLQGFCVISSGEPIQEDERNSFFSIAIQLVIGAMREHFAALTSRGPWGTHLINPIPLSSNEKKDESQTKPNIEGKPKLKFIR